MMDHPRGAFFVVGSVIAAFAFWIGFLTADNETETKTETVTARVVPAACLNALDLAEEGFQLSGESMLIFADMLELAAVAVEHPFAVDAADIAEVDRHNENLRGLSAQLETVVGPLNEAKAECRAEANGDG